MKKLFFSTLLAISLASSAFAAETKKVSSAATNTFAADFKKATEITWSVTDEYAKATFVLNNQKMEAFYNVNGEIIGTSTHAIIEDLPVHAKRSFAKKFNGYTVKEIIHFDGTEETAYYISAENDKETVILKVGVNEALTTFATTKK